MGFSRIRRKKTSLPCINYCVISGVLHCRAQVIITAYYWATFALINECMSHLRCLSRGEASSHATVFVTFWYSVSKFVKFSWGSSSVFERWESMPSVKTARFQSPPVVGPKFAVLEGNCWISGYLHFRWNAPLSCSNLQLCDLDRQISWYAREVFP